MSDGSSDVDSRWWLLVLAMPIVTVVEACFAVLLAGFVYVSADGMDPSMVLVAAAPFLAIAVIVRAGLPIALYRDARAIRDADVEWAPDPANWGFLGLGLIVVPVLDSLLAAVYLTRRSRALAD
ncbi:hypothetical protein MBEHAL_0249 [Halarchaeum acidiphilum MH1-52-1]|uniref:Uncharacterized protein n=1 Tax=Halarchaeum acidiphilum MH1-52-1 TaxID=1261545 RepID=U3A1G7_9EURY|nr:hypothetical protein [Halarchaeum acidiphilum]GAD51489.1 hypothetical protein MBEHAL_0249 [Halarchaeum acidiphilum MH1-52-1]